MKNYMSFETETLKALICSKMFIFNIYTYILVGLYISTHSWYNINSLGNILSFTQQTFIEHLLGTVAVSEM